MRKQVSALGGLLVLAGAAGLIHELVGWFRLWAVVRHLGFLDGYEIWANLGLLVLGLALAILADPAK